MFADGSRARGVQSPAAEKRKPLLLRFSGHLIVPKALLH